MSDRGSNLIACIPDLIQLMLPLLVPDPLPVFSECSKSVKAPQLTLNAEAIISCCRPELTPYYVTRLQFIKNYKPLCNYKVVQP